MAAATISLKAATPHRLVYELAGDGDPTDTEISNVKLISDSVAGPLRTTLEATYASQALARSAMLYGNPVRIRTTLRVRQSDVTAEKNQPSVDVNVSASLVVVNVQQSDTVGQIVIVEIEYVHSLVS